MRAAERIALALVLGATALGWDSASFGGASSPGAPLQARTSISIKGLDAGRVRLQRGTQKLVLDLGREIAGCKGRLYDPTDQEAYEDSGVTFEIVDETEKASYAYVVLLASAPPNCNVQGTCGADGTDLTLLWLKLTRDLTLAGKQAFAFEDCLAGRSARIERQKDPGGKDPDVDAEIKASDLPWAGDVLQIDYTERDEAVRRLTYDRKNPDAGLRKIPAGGR